MQAEEIALQITDYPPNPLSLWLWLPFSLQSYQQIFALFDLGNAQFTGNREGLVAVGEG